MATTVKTNIATLTVPVNLKKAMECIYDCFRAERHNPTVRQTPFLLGAPGQGKTAIVSQFVKKLNEDRFRIFDRALANALGRGLSETDAHKEAEEFAGKPWVLRSIRLSQVDPTDLKGVPVYKTVNGQELCAFAGPTTFPYIGMPDSADGNRVVLFLDELPQATPVIQNLAANIYDGVVGDQNIDFNRCFIIIAGNRKEDKAATYDIPMNVGNRVISLNVTTTPSEWEEWAVSEGVNPLVVGYLKENTAYFNEPAPEKGYTYGTPRSWTRVAALIDSMKDQFFEDSSTGLNLAIGSVGVSNANAFYQFCQKVMKDYSMDDIMHGKKVKVPESRDIIYSLMLEATYRINSWVAPIYRDPAFQDLSNDWAKVKGPAVVRALGPDKIKWITNIYKWVANPANKIDPAFQVLLNKYQNTETKGILRMTTLLMPELKECAEYYTAIHEKLASKH